MQLWEKLETEWPGVTVGPSACLTWWCNWLGVGLVIKRSWVRLPVGARLRIHYGQVVHTLVSVSPRCTRLYRSVSGHALRLGGNRNALEDFVGLTTYGLKVYIWQMNTPPSLLPHCISDRFCLYTGAPMTTTQSLLVEYTRYLDAGIEWTDRR